MSQWLHDEVTRHLKTANIQWRRAAGLDGWTAVNLDDPKRHYTFREAVIQSMNAIAVRDEIKCAACGGPTPQSRLLRCAWLVSYGDRTIARLGCGCVLAGSEEEQGQKIRLRDRAEGRMVCVSCGVASSASRCSSCARWLVVGMLDQCHELDESRRMAADEADVPRESPAVGDIPVGKDIWPSVAETRSLTGMDPIDLFGIGMPWCMHPRHGNSMHCAFVGGRVLRVDLKDIEDHPVAPALANQPMRARAEAIRSVIIQKARTP